MSTAASSAAASRRPWWRLHPLTWCILLLTAAVLFLLIVPGERTPLVSASLNRIDGLFDHGWPWTFMHRKMPTPPNYNGHWINLLLDWEPRDAVWEEPASWSLSQGVELVNCLALVGDVGVALLLLCLSAAVGETWVRTRERWWQFGIKSLLAVTAIVAIALAWWRANALEVERERVFLEDWRQIAETTRSHSLFPPYATLSFHGPKWLYRLVGGSRLPWCWRADRLCRSPRDNPRGGIFFDPPLTDESKAALLANAARSLRHVRHAVVDGFDHDVLELIAVLPNVDELTHEGKLKSSAFQEFARMKRLNKLSIKRGAICDELMTQFHTLPHLESLTFEGSDFSGAQLRLLVDCSSLKRLVVCGCRGDGIKAGLVELRRLRPDLEVIEKRP